MRFKLFKSPTSGVIILSLAWNAFALGQTDRALDSTIGSLALLSRVASFPNLDADWPPTKESLIPDQFPIVIQGLRKGDLGAVFHVEEFDSKTTLLRGYIELTNMSANPITINVCLAGYSFGYQMQMRDANHKMVPLRWEGSQNFNATSLYFNAAELKKVPFGLRLKDYFRIEKGVYEILFVFDERLVAAVPERQSPMKRWSTTSFVIKSETSGAVSSEATQK